MSRSLVDLVRDRARKNGLYDGSAYWDMKASTYRGLARSNWPSNAYNECVHASQMALIDRVLGDVRGRAVVDIGCGTGRASQHLSRRGARVFGYDFSERAVDAARVETESLGLSARFEVRDLFAPTPAEHLDRYDAALSLACLTVACRDVIDIDRALSNVASQLKRHGRVLFLEPLHSSRLLRRIAPLDARDFALRAAHRGFVLVDRGGIQFVPTRYALAFREAPRPWVTALYGAGERALEKYPSLEPLSDYKWLLFERR